MTDAEVKQTILDIIQELAPDEDLSQLNEEERIRDQIELDSMDFLDIIMELRKRYNVHVPEEDYGQLATLKGSVLYLAPLLRSQSA